ncbi:MAG: metallophosphoesterase family protein [Anaerolineae bacterium]|nr:metallophosphoesterase family protein [Anaerolineae bacterium]
MSERIAIIADTHANNAATSAVLDDIAAQKIKVVWCLGDMIGRGPNAVKTLNLLWPVYQQQAPRDRRAWLIGNHEMVILDKVLHGHVDGSVVGGNGKLATFTGEKNREELDKYVRGDEIRNFLNQLHPYATEPPRPGIYVAHAHYALCDDGSVDVVRAYSQTNDSDARIGDAVRSLLVRLPRAEALRIIITAHTHVSGIWHWDASDQTAKPVPNHKTGQHTFSGLSEHPLYVNPGSVGFPRVPDNTPTYVVVTLSDDLESATLEFRQVSYYRDDLDLPGWYPALYRDDIDRTSL